MDELISTSRLKALLGVGKAALTELSARGILQRGAKKDTYRLEASVRGYIASLREQAFTRGSEAAVEARALGAAPADLSEVKAEQLRGELEAAEVEKLWTSKLRVFRDRILAIPHRVQYLSARQTMVLTQELRAAIDELTDDKAP
jgi:phage terminase Nu1 subunit (DNA packaging protein)